MHQQANAFLALVKFFRETEHLEMFLDGKIYCNTPEYYRLSNAPGISDRNESCHFSIRNSRGDSVFQADVNGIPAGDVVDFTVRNGRNDGWLHCWAVLRTPETDIDLEKLQCDFDRMKSEFGPHYVFVKAEDSHELARRMATSVDNCIECHEVEYAEHTILGDSIKTKHIDFSYQREFRFIFEECLSNEETEAKVYTSKNGFRDIAHISPKFELVAHANNKEHRFTLK